MYNFLMNNIKLNVGGRMFETTYDTLIKIPYFKNMFDGCDGELNEVIFVNRSPLVFEHVFAFVLDPLHPYPKSYLYELDFYGIDYSNVEFDNDEIMICLKNQNVTIELMCNQIDNIRHKIDRINNSSQSRTQEYTPPYYPPNYNAPYKGRCPY